MIKVKENRDRTERFHIKVDRRKKRLRDPPEVGKKVLVLGERLRKKMLLEDSIKAQQKIKSFLTETEVSKLNNNTYLYWLKKTVSK